MLKYLNKKIALQFVIFLGLFAFSVYTIITKSQVFDSAGTPFLFQSFARILSHYKYVGRGIVVAVLVFQLIFIQYYFKINEYSAKNSFLPACFYLAILLLRKSLITISPFFFTLSFFLIIISIDLTETSIKLKNNLFWAGTVIALATAFDISGIILFVIAVVTLIINQFSRIKEIGILIFAFLLLYFYFFSFHFFTNNLNEWLLTFQQMKIMSVWSIPVTDRSLTTFSLISLGLIFLFFIIKFKLVNDSKLLTQRSKIFTLNIRATLMIVCIFISNSSYPEVLGYLFVHLSIYLAMLAQEKSPWFLNEFITIITFVALWH
jgi:hypothetical protein